MITIYFDDIKNDVRTSELIEELESRSLDNDEIASILRIGKADNPKIDFLMSVVDGYTLDELKEMFKDSKPVAGQNQIPLNFNT